MATKMQYYRQMAEETAASLTHSREQWTAFLRTAGRVSKYAYGDQLMIFAQRPNATACAEYDLWNNTMRRYVKRGSKGIALIDNSGDYPRLRYVFDVADTGARRNSRPVNLWQMREEYERPVQEALAAVFEVSARDPLDVQVENIANWLAIDYWMEHESELADIVADSFLEGYDEDSRRMSFLNAATVSIKYEILSRCVENPDDYFEPDEFTPVFDYNTRKATNALGTAVSEISGQVFREIEVTIRNYERSKRMERSHDYGTDLHAERGLPDPQPHPQGDQQGTPGQVRTDAPGFSTGASPDPVQRPVPDGAVVPPSQGDRRDGAQPDGAVDAGAAGEEPRPGQADAADGLGTAHEQPEGSGGGDRADGAGVQLNPFEQEPVQYEQMTLLFPTETEQIEAIDHEAESETPSAFVISDSEIIRILQTGSGFADGKLRIAALYAHEGNPKARADFLKKEYGIGGQSWDFSDGSRGLVDYRAKGLYIRSYDHNTELRLRWIEVEKRIDTLIQADRYLSPEEQARYVQMEQDFAGYGGIPMPSAQHAFPTSPVAAPEEPVSEEPAPVEDDFSDIDPEWVRERLAEHGIVNGEVVDPEKLEQSPFIQQVEADVERIAEEAAEKEAPVVPETDDEAVASEDAPEDRFRVVEVDWYPGHVAYSIWDDQTGKYYEDADSVTVDFLSRWQAEEYRNELVESVQRETTLSPLDRAKKLIDEYCLEEFSESADFTDLTTIGVAFTTITDDEIPIQAYVDLVGFKLERYLGEALIDVRQYDSLEALIAGELEELSFDDLTYASDEQIAAVLAQEAEQADAPLAEQAEQFETEQQDYRNQVLSGLTPDQQRIVMAMETAGFPFRPSETAPIYFGDLDDYPITFDSWDTAYEFINNAELKDTPGLREQVQAVLHPEAAFPYNVGDTVYLEDGKPFVIDSIGTSDVHLLDPSLRFPVLRAESRENFLRLMERYPQEQQAEQAAPFIDHFYVVDDLAHRGQLRVSEYATLDEALAAYQALPMTQRKALGIQNSSAPYPGSLDFVQCIDGQNVLVQDYLKVEGDGWRSQEILDVVQRLEKEFSPQQQEVTEEPVAFYPGEQNSLPFDVEVRTLHFGEPEQDEPEQVAAEPSKWNVVMVSGRVRQVLSAGFETEAEARRFAENMNWTYVDENQFEWGLEVEEALGVQRERVAEPETAPDETVSGTPVSVQIGGEWRTFPNREAAEEALYADYKEQTHRNAQNFHITDDALGEGGPKAKYQANVAAIRLLQHLETEGLQASPEQQEVLSCYVGWGALSDAFDPNKPTWAKEYQELKSLLTEDEYAAARASTLNAHYTSPTVIKAIYEAVGNMGFQSGNILEPSMGVGNFFGLLPEAMQGSKLYGVELDSITGRIARQLYPHADIKVAGFETTDRRDFYDLAVGNVPFGDYKVNDRPYNKLGFSIHNYFFAKALDQVRPGGVVAFVTSRYTMDAKSPEVRKYLAQRAELLGAIRLPNNAFRANAGTDVVSDILFLQRRETPIDIEPDWVHLGQTPEGFAINSYFVDHPEMVLGELTSQSTQYGKDECTVAPIPGADLAEQLHEAVSHIYGQYQAVALETEEADIDDAPKVLPADPNVKNFSYTVVDGEVYFRENSVMRPVELNDKARGRVTGLVLLRQIVNELIEYQMEDYPEEDISAKQRELNIAYDSFTAQYGIINSRGNAQAFADDSSYYLLCSLENLDEDGKFIGKADMFTKRTIRPERKVTSVDTPSEALAVSIGERGRVDLPFMSALMGTPGEYDRITRELSGVIFKDPLAPEGPEQGWQTADEYLSGNVRDKLRVAKLAAETDGRFAVNVAALEQAQPKELDASEIDVRLGSTWVDPKYIQQFMEQTFETPFYLRRAIEVKFSPYTAEWRITGKTQPRWDDVAAYTTYGTGRANAYRILEETLNLKDIRIYDTVEDPDGKQKRVLNKKETTLAQQKQQAIKDAFQDWVWKDPRRREALCKRYNELFNSTRPREYDGSHIHFVGMNPEITLREHQKNAIAHVLYGGNTLLAHEVGAGKTFEMAASAMESKRLGLCQKSMFVVPNHLTMQWANEFLRLYPSAKLLVTTRKDFETSRRKKFCARIATGDYDAIIIGHSQFEKIPISVERQERLLREQIDDITDAIAAAKYQRGENFTIKQLEKTKRSLEARLDKLLAAEKKDDVITFEQLGVDRLYVDESQAYKNLFLYTKMRNVAGLSTSESQRSSDMYMKCRYMDELTGGRGIVFATGTPVSNSMTELYTVMRYLQYGTLQQKGLTHFDCWASTFGETTTSIELDPQGTGYRARTRFAKFFNLPELMNLFKEVADIKTSDQLNLPVPEAHFETVVVKPSDIQKEMVASLSERAAKIHARLVDPSEDNMLCITSDGRKIGLDQRLMNPLLPDDPGSKLNACVNNVFRIWQEGAPGRLTQLLFCDMSTPKNDGSFNVYDDIRSKLEARGVPHEEIAFIHDADSEAKKKALFSKVRTGQVRVLLGSTQKMGAGTNVQDRLVAVHHLDVGWRPADMTQRNGRIIRQGNRNKRVQVFNYVTEGTFDAYLWQTLENKQKFISQIMTSKSPVRSCDDVDEQVLSYAEVKALCAGDERIKEKMDLDIDVARLKVVRADFLSNQYRLEDRLLKHFPAQIEKQQGYIQGFEADIQTAAAHPLPKEGFVGMEVNGRRFTEKQLAGEAILAACRDCKGAEPVPLGSYRGFQMELSYDSFRQEVDLTLKGSMSHRLALGTDARGNLTRIDNALAGIPVRLEAAKEQLANLENQREAAKAEIGKPFPQEAELREKSARLAELDAALNLAENPTPQEERGSGEERTSVLADLKQKSSQVPPPKKGDRQREEEVL